MGKTKCSGFWFASPLSLRLSSLRPRATITVVIMEEVSLIQTLEDMAILVMLITDMVIVVITTQASPAMDTVTLVTQAVATLVIIPLAMATKVITDTVVTSTAAIPTRQAITM